MHVQTEQITRQEYRLIVIFFVGTGFWNRVPGCWNRRCVQLRRQRGRRLHATTGVLRAQNQLCRQHRLWGYRSRTRTLTLTLKLTLTLTLFFKYLKNRVRVRWVLGLGLGFGFGIGNLIGCAVGTVDSALARRLLSHAGACHAACATERTSGYPDSILVNK